MAKREWRRTCKRCSQVWFAPIEVKPNRLEIGGYKMGATGSRLTLFGGRKASSQEVRAQSLQAKRDRIESLERCPQCGLRRTTKQGCGSRNLPSGRRGSRFRGAG